MALRSATIDEHVEFAEAMLQADPDAVLVVRATGDIVFVNGPAQRMFHFPSCGLAGITVDMLLPESLRPVHRANRTRYQAEPTTRAMGAGLDLWAQGLDGRSFPVEISLSPLVLGAETYTVASVRDITQRAEDKDELQRVLRTLDASDDGVFIFDAATLAFLYVNEGAVRLVGYRKDELLSMTPLHLNPFATEAQYLTLIESLTEQGASSTTFETTLLQKDGVEIPVEMTLQSAPVGRDGSRSVITLARDITARHMATRELNLSQNALRDAQQVLAVSDDRERIARDIHDVVIQKLFGEGLSLQAALTGLDDPVKSRARIESTINGLDGVIRELRSAIFSLQPSDAAPGGFRQLLTDVATDVTKDSDLRVHVEFEGSIETIAGRIAEELSPVLRECVTNIVRHAGAHHVGVTLRAGAFVTLTVTDDGVGMPDDVLAGNGLANMVERARRLSGNCSVSPGHDGGTVMTWSVPTGAVGTGLDDDQ